jgi:hypothetical protein
MSASRVDFAYAFSTPHRLTVARPDSGDKTLLDLQPGSLQMSWTYDNLVRFPVAAFATPTTPWSITIKPQIDSQPLSVSTWMRLDGFLPALENRYTDSRGEISLQVVGGETAALIKIHLTNTGDLPHQFIVSCTLPAPFGGGYNPGWVDSDQPADHLLTGWRDRADRVLVLGLNADRYTTFGSGSGNNADLCWTLAPGESRTGWIVRPYRAYETDLPKLRTTDWANEFQIAVDEWKTLLGRIANFSIPDPGVKNALLACFADLFIMREPIADGYIAATPGTECYRAPNSTEPLLTAIAFDQFGLHNQALVGTEANLKLQGDDGNWSDPQGWNHKMWSTPGFKSWAVMEHYHLTGDKDYLARIFPRMLASSRFNERQRSKTRKNENGQRSLTYGLLPRGQGDCGLMNDNDFYGVFLPHNIWPTFADGCSVEAARILNRPELAELEKIYQTALEDLRTALDRGAIQEKDYRWIPGISGKTSGSRWGALNALFPCQILPADHELITGTMRHIESNLSPGGIPVNTGWMKNGMWVAITLDNVAQAHLVRGNGDAAAEYLYATLNHGTPLYTWCEERGQEPGAKECTGDRQHLWTPVAVVLFIRNAFVMEENDGLNLALGTARSWLACGEPVGVENAPTHFGEISYRLQYDAHASKVTGYVKFTEQKNGPAWTKLYIRLPRNMKVQKSNQQILTDGSGLYLTHCRGELKIEADLG